MRKPRADLEQQLEKNRRELADAREQLAEALARETATSEVLHVISSSPGALEPVFQALLANAVRICEAKFGNLFIYENNSFRVVAMQNAPPAYREFWEREPVVVVGDEPGVPLARQAATKGVIHITNLAAERGLHRTQTACRRLGRRRWSADHAAGADAQGGRVGRQHRHLPPAGTTV
jgi:hypothetical protein